MFLFISLFISSLSFSHIELLVLKSTQSLILFSVLNLQPKQTSKQTEPHNLALCLPLMNGLDIKLAQTMLWCSDFSILKIKKFKFSLKYFPILKLWYFSLLWDLGLKTDVCLCAQSFLTLCNPMDCSLPGSSVLGTFQVIILEYVVISSSRGYSWPRDQTHTSCIGSQILLPWHHLGSPTERKLKIPFISSSSHF